jgi:hypothetical protein
MMGGFCEAWSIQVALLAFAFSFSRAKHVLAGTGRASDSVSSPMIELLLRIKQCKAAQPLIRIMRVDAER